MTINIHLLLFGLPCGLYVAKIQLQIYNLLKLESIYAFYSVQTTYSISKYDIDTLFDFQNRNESNGWSCWDFVLSVL
jgi:hypothetical protein